MKGRRIVVDGYNLLLPRGTGIATYARNLITTVQGLGADTEVLAPIQFRPSLKWPELTEIRFLEGKAAPSARFPWLRNMSDFARSLTLAPLPHLKLSGIATSAAGGSLPEGVSYHLGHRLIEQSRAKFVVLGRDREVRLETQPDLFHCTYQLPLRVRGAANIYTIHDLIPLRLPGSTLDDKRHTFRILKHLAAKADHLVTVSEYSRRDIIEILGVSEDRVTNTYQSVEIPARILSRSPDKVAEIVGRFFNLDYRGYFLFCGAIEPKKNVLRLINAHVASAVKEPLIIVGPEAWMADREMERIRDPAFETLHIDNNEIKRRHRVRHINYLPRDLLLYLIQGARGLIFPSLYEGFGLPVLEAMLLGTPVITSNSTSLPEVAGEAALLVNPLEESEISQAICALSEDNDLWQELASRGRVQAALFSPQIYSQRLAALYSKLL